MLKTNFAGHNEIREEHKKLEGPCPRVPRPVARGLVLRTKVAFTLTRVKYIALRAEPYQLHSIPPNWGAHAVTGGPKFEAGHHFAPQRKLLSSKLKYEAIEISEFREPFERKVHYSFFGPL